MSSRRGDESFEAKIRDLVIGLGRVSPGIRALAKAAYRHHRGGQTVAPNSFCLQIINALYCALHHHRSSFESLVFYLLSVSPLSSRPCDRKISLTRCRVLLKLQELNIPAFATSHKYTATNHG